jgi:uncharacterized membrane protein
MGFICQECWLNDILNSVTYLPVTAIAYLLNAVSVTIDKFLLNKQIPNPLIYVFYFSLVSCGALVLLPFAALPSLWIFILASSSTLLWTLGAYFMFKALQTGQISRVIPVIGTLIPLILLGVGLFQGTVSNYEGYAIGALVLGLVFLTLFDWKGGIDKKEIWFEVLSSIFFAVSYIVLRMAYEGSNFWTVFVYSRPILIPVGIILLILPVSRKIILQAKKPHEQAQKIPYWKRMLQSGAVWLFGAGQVAAGASQLLLTFAISLANPAVVNALQGVQYIFLFIGNIFLSKKYPHIFKENTSPSVMVFKVAGIICVCAGLYMLANNIPSI